MVILQFIGLVTSESDHGFINQFQQPSYIYPGGHPVYKMAGLKYAYPFYNLAAVPKERAETFSQEMGKMSKANCMTVNAKVR